MSAVLKFWVDYDVENLFRTKSGIHRFRVPAEYETNSTKFTAWMEQGGKFRDESFPLAQRRLNELMGAMATHYHRKRDLVNAALCALALRHLSPRYSDPFDPHDAHLHTELNKLFGIEPPRYLFQACDSLLRLVKEELARHGIEEQRAALTERE